jgi:hypothetical protein
MIMADLWDNAQQGAKVKGGSSVRNRALELLGKELGMFKDQEQKPLRAEDLTIEQIEQMLATPARKPSNKSKTNLRDCARTGRRR